MVGDYLLSKGLLLSIDNGDFDLLRIISVAVREMSEGELLQIEKARRLDITDWLSLTGYEIVFWSKNSCLLIAALVVLSVAQSQLPEDSEVLVEKNAKIRRTDEEGISR